MEEPAYLTLKLDNSVADVQKIVMDRIANRVMQVDLTFRFIKVLCLFRSLYMCFREYLAIIYKSILAQMTFDTGYPILWLSLKGGESNMMYRGPKIFLLKSHKI